jgi:hypothetical protein
MDFNVGMKKASRLNFFGVQFSHSLMGGGSLSGNGLPVIKKRDVLAYAINGHGTGKSDSSPLESLIEKLVDCFVLAAFPNCSLDLLGCKGGSSAPCGCRNQRGHHGRHLHRPDTHRHLWFLPTAFRGFQLNFR